MKKKSRALAFVLALVLTLSLCPVGLAASNETYDPNDQCGSYWGKDENGVDLFEITIPDDESPQPYPYTNVSQYNGVNFTSGILGVTLDKRFYGRSPGTGIVEYSVDGGSYFRHAATVYVTVVSASEYSSGSGALNSHTHRWSRNKYETSGSRVLRTYQECLLCHRQQTISSSNPTTSTQTPDPVQTPEPTQTPAPVQTSAPTQTPEPAPTQPGTSAHTHQYVTKVVKEATCQATGTSQEECSICGAVRSGSTRILPKTASHTWEDKTTPATCTRTGSSWQQCSVCGTTQNRKTLPKTEHSYVEGTVVRQPTVTQTGQRMDKCSVCGAATYVELPKKEEAPLGPHISGSYAMSKLSQQEIRQLLAANPLTLPSDVFEQVPHCSAPYSPGKVKTEPLQAATNRLNALRKIAGLPSVVLDLSMCQDAQYGAVIIAAMGKLDHYPQRLSDMDEAFYKKAYAATSSANLAAGYSLTSAVDGFMNDSDASNISAVGHRWWQLNPAMGKVGFGYATASGGYGRYVDQAAHDKSAPAFDYDFVGWPASGNFPSDLFGKDIAWSVSVNPERYQQPQQSQLTITLTRKSDGRTWSFSGSSYTAANAGAYFNVDARNSGRNAIIFRPDGIDKYEGVYTVKIDGLKTLGGKSVTDFQYEVEFFALNMSAETGTPGTAEQPSTPEQPGTPGNPGTTPSGARAFADVPASEWFYDSIQQAYADGVIDGTSYNAATGVRMFSPNKTLTLAEFTAIVTRGFYPSEIGQRNASQPWYTPNVTVADRHGLLNGVGTRNMDSPASRFQMAQIMLNILTDKGGTALSSSAVNQTASQISDWNKVSTSYQTAVATCYSLGLLKGNDSSGTFNGAATMRRSECATVYIRLRDHLKGSQPAQPSTGTQPAQPVQTTPAAGDYSESYQSSKYYAALKAVTLTGDYRRDIIAIAASQVGYCESNSESDLTGTKSGSSDWTEYGRFMNTNGTAWCSEFASWCIRQAGVPTSVIHSSAGASVKVFAAPYHGWSETVFAGGSYMPQAGDLVLYAWSGTSHTANALSHTGIVERVDWDGRSLTIHTIEGNSNNCVRRKDVTVTPSTGAVSGGHIVYFVAPDY